MNQHENPFFQLTESSPDAIYVAIGGRFSYLNPAAVRLFGATSAAQLFGEPFIERIHPDDRAVVADRARRLYENGEPASLLEETYLRLDGTPISVEVSAVPFRYEDANSALVFVRDITLRRRAQDEIRALNQTLEQRVNERTQELRAKKEQLRETLALNENILTASAAGILAYGEDGQCMLANPAAHRLVGGTQQQLRQQNFRRLESWRTSGLLNAAERVLTSGVGEEIEVRFTSTFGRDVWAAVQLTRFVLAGEPHLLVVLHDVTTARQAAQALAEREQEFRTLADNVPDNIVRYDLAGRVRYFNRTVERTLGCAVAEVIGKSARELCGFEGRYDALEDAVRRVGATGECDEFEQVVPGPDGQPRYHLIRMVPEWGADGRPAGVLAVGRDLTEQKLAEERTRQAATVFENATESIVITDLGGRTRAVNRAFAETTGYSEAEVLGRSPSLLKSGRHGPEFYQALWESVLTAGQWQGEIWNRRKNGELYPSWMTITTVRDEHGRPTHYVAVSTDISHLKRSEEKLAHLAHYDPLTDLPNRLLLQSRLAHALERAERSRGRAAVLFIDLDHFKMVNDSFGHAVGDGLLLDVARRMRERVRDEDTLGRFGGDEFLLVLEQIRDPEEAAVVARDLLTALESPFRLDGGSEVYVGASIGVSVYPDDSINATNLLRDAGAAMYQAKERGRNRFCFYRADMNVKAVAQLELEAAMRRALERGEFVLHYQPKADLRTGLVHGAEALIRWQSGSRLLSPADFIPLAEKTGLIVPIGNWVIDTACRQLRVWHEDGLREMRVAVNVSSRQFHSGDLAAIVARALACHDVPASCLELELTESMLMEDPEQTVAILEDLKRIGVKLALDDFGTGYSSFAYLSRFPIDALKIDRSFVRDIVTEPQSAMIAVSIIDLAHRLRLKVVAEGVETESQLGYLRMRDCDEMQGYYFARPMPTEDFEALLREGRSLPSTQAAESPEDRTLLVVDDEPSILAALRRVLRREGYRILTAESGAGGLELLATNRVQVILSDQRMPEMTGTEFLSRVKELHPDTVRMVLTGYTDLDSVTKAVNGGAIYKFLSKPWDDGELREHIRDAFGHYEKVIRPRAAQSEF